MKVEFNSSQLDFVKIIARGQPFLDETIHFRLYISTDIRALNMAKLEKKQLHSRQYNLAHCARSTIPRSKFDIILISSRKQHLMCYHLIHHLMLLSFEILKCQYILYRFNPGCGNNFRNKLFTILRCLLASNNSFLRYLFNILAVIILNCLSI